MTTAVVFTCAHTSPKVDNKRFDLLGNLIFDIRPDYVFDLGDFSDLSSLNSYDTRYPKAIVSQNYQEDIECTIDAQERLRDKFVRRKVRKPIWIAFEGNHEHRIKKALQHDPRVEGKKYGILFSPAYTKVLSCPFLDSSPFLLSNVATTPIEPVSLAGLTMISSAGHKRA